MNLFELIAVFTLGTAAGLGASIFYIRIRRKGQLADVHSHVQDSIDVTEHLDQDLGDKEEEK